VTPTPNYYSRGERIVSASGDRHPVKLQVMERGVYLEDAGRHARWPGTQIIFNATRIGGTWSNWHDLRSSAAASIEFLLRQGAG
jgi:hypothetical protein